MATRNPTQPTPELQEALINDPDFLRDLLTILLQNHLNYEMITHLQANSYERTPSRTGYRNGYKPRQLKTRVGNLELLIPQDREGTFQTELFEKYQRHEKALVLSLMQMYIEGVSTRKVSDITEKLCGSKFSKSTISNLTKQLDTELSAWRNCPLEMPYCYVMVDALYEYVRINHQVLTQGVLIVKGIRADGKREVLAVTVADTESEASYQELFRSLKDRGLKGVRLVISDDHKGLRAAIQRHFQGACWQRCQVHFCRTLLGRVARSRRKELAGDLQRIFGSSSREWAIQAAQEVATAWRGSHPDVAEVLEEDLEGCLACYSFPREHQKKIRSTNALERLNQEIRRRTRVVRIFPNRESCLRLVTALCIERSEEWLSGKRYLDMSLLASVLDREEVRVL